MSVVSVSETSSALHVKIPPKVSAQKPIWFYASRPRPPLRPWPSASAKDNMWIFLFYFRPLVLIILGWVTT